MFCFLVSHVHVSYLIKATIHDDLTIYIGMAPEMFKCFGKKLYMTYKKEHPQREYSDQIFYIFFPLSSRYQPQFFPLISIQIRLMIISLYPIIKLVMIPFTSEVAGLAGANDMIAFR